MKKFKLNFKWFTWRFMPRKEELSVKSILETVLYLLFFILCCYFFICWNDVPIRKDTIYVDCLGKSTKYGEQEIAPAVKICYCIPMTSVGWEPEEETKIYCLSAIDSQNYSPLYKDSLLLYPQTKKVVPGISFEFTPWTTSSRLDNLTNVIFQEPYNSSSTNDSIKKEEKRKNPFWESLFGLGPGYPYNYVMNYLLHKHDNYWSDNYYSILMNKRYVLHKKMIESKLPQRYDSLQKEFMNKVHQKYGITNIKSSLYYANWNSLHYNRWGFPFSSSESYNNDKKNISIYRHNDLSRRESECEIYATVFPWEGGIHYIRPGKGFGDNIFKKPSWFRLEDISQVYYDLKLESLTVDSIILKFEFVGATDFSIMKPQPDKITMSSIEFSDPQKILDIKLNGLKFHAKFKELENKQYIRVFFVTTILGGLLLIFFALLFSGIIKCIIIQRGNKQNKTSKVPQTQGTDTTDTVTQGQARSDG